MDFPMYVAVRKAHSDWEKFDLERLRLQLYYSILPHLSEEYRGQPMDTIIPLAGDSDSTKQPPKKISPAALDSLKTFNPNE
jgi:hypothetical protein